MSSQISKYECVPLYAKNSNFTIRVKNRGKWNSLLKIMKKIARFIKFGLITSSPSSFSG